MKPLMPEFLLSEVLEKVVRVERFLDEAGFRSVRPDETKIIESFKETMHFVKSDLENVIDILKDYHQGDEIPIELLVPCVKSILRINLKIDLLHPYLEYIPIGTEIPPETYRFIDDMIQRFDLKNPDEPPFEYVLVLIRDFNFGHGKIFGLIKERWREHGVETSTSRRRNPSVIGIPRVEARNPHRWPLLIHELGHAIYDEINITYEILDGVKLPLEEGKTIKNWISEFFADLISMRFLGTAYFVSFLLFSILHYELDRPSSTHPSAADRITLFRKQIENGSSSSEMITQLLEIWDERCKLEKDWPLRPPEDRDRDRRKPTEVQVNDEVITNSIPKIEKILNERIPCIFDSTNFENCIKLVEELSRGIPIGSSRKFSEDDIKSQLKEYIREENPRKGSREELLAYLDEHPNDFTEIISAACIHRHEHLFKQFQTIFFETNSPFDEKCKEYKDMVLAADELILKSFESAAVHYVHYIQGEE